MNPSCCLYGDLSLFVAPFSRSAVQCITQRIDCCSAAAARPGVFFMLLPLCNNAAAMLPRLMEIKQRRSCGNS